jgi:hypothetical protein
MWGKLSFLCAVKSRTSCHVTGSCLHVFLLIFLNLDLLLQMIEYIGEIVRPPISDIRERRIYNSLVVSFFLAFSSFFTIADKF